MSVANRTFIFFWRWFERRLLVPGLAGSDPGALSGNGEFTYNNIHHIFCCFFYRASKLVFLSRPRGHPGTDPHRFHAAFLVFQRDGADYPVGGQEK